jgi:hypothetical protein
VTVVAPTDIALELPDSQVNSVFQQPWWLEAVAPGQWGAAEYRVAGELRGRHPYVLRRTRGLTVLAQPPFTQTLGPWLARSEAKYAKSLGQQKDVMEALIAQLPVCDYFAQNFHHTVVNCLPFVWQGFEPTVRYTYVLEALGDLEAVWDGFLDNIRREVRKAERQLAVDESNDLEELMRLVTLTFERQGLRHRLDIDALRRVDAACAQRAARSLLLARDASGRTHAAAYLVWDRNSAYYLLGGADPDLRSSGAQSLVLWNAIRRASGHAQSFDFEGSMLEPVERFFRAFGARQRPYLRLVRMSRRMSALWHGYRAVRSLAKRQ